MSGSLECGLVESNVLGSGVSLRASTDLWTVAYAATKIDVAGGYGCRDCQSNIRASLRGMLCKLLPRVLLVKRTSDLLRRGWLR